MTLRLLAAAALVASAGCAPVEPWVELGVGEDGFTAVEDGDVLPAENGSQGGRHVWVGLRAGGVEPGSLSDADAMRTGDRPRVDFRLEGPGGVYSLDVARFVPLDDGPDCYELAGRLLPFRLYAELPEGWQSTDWDAVQDALELEVFELVVSLEDADGRSLEDRRDVFIDFP